MNNLRRMLRTSSAVVAVVATAAQSAAQQSPAQPPPPELIGSEKGAVSLATSYGVLEAGVEYTMEGKEILIRWFRDYSSYGAAYESNRLSSQGRHFSLQKESVGFWPTEVCGYGENKICVAGKTLKGKTKIQIWEFSASEELVDPGFDVHSLPVYPTTYIPIASKTTIYNENVAGKKLVRNMFRNHGYPDSLFVQFHDSSDLYQLDTSSGALALELSVAEEPLLSNVAADRWSAHHSDEGYMYFFSWSPPNKENKDMLLLFDSDLDGFIDPEDTKHLTTAAEWAPYADGTAYDEFY